LLSYRERRLHRVCIITRLSQFKKKVAYQLMGGGGRGGVPDMQPVNTIRAVSMRKIGGWRLISNGGNKIEVSSTRGNYAQRVIDFVLLIVEQVIGRGTYSLNKELMVNTWGVDRGQD